MKVLFIDTVHDILQKRLEQKGVECIDGTTWSLEVTKEALTDMDGIVIRSRFRLDESILKFAPQLKFIARSGAGMENIDSDYCEKRNIQLFNAPEGNCTAVAEHALGMILALFNQLKKGDAEIRKGIWDREGNRGLELTGKTVGIIGYGHNGSAFAKVLRGFDCKILAYDKYKTGFGNDWVTESTLEELYEQAEIISFHIPQNEETIYWGNTDFFEQVKHPFFLINLSRGKIIRIADLMNAINNGKVKGAVLDVLEFESSSFASIFGEDIPTDFKELIKSDKVLLSPHVGGWTVESYFKLSNVLADKVIAAYF
ncbi:MAG: phosphoglycerate dehydrogenase [Crocinitomicaceae bacterium]|nr:phosphoglycerate dehydrogenase [Crocinitomicaceae bacterium]